MKSKKYLILTFVLLFFWICLGIVTAASDRGVSSNLGPFPIISEIFDKNDQVLGEMHLYPSYSEIHDLNKNLVFRVGTLHVDGQTKIFISLATEPPKLVAFAEGYSIYDVKGNLIGGYHSTPTYSYSYALTGEKVGKVHCLAWSTVCGAGSAVYLLLLT